MSRRKTELAAITCGLLCLLAAQGVSADGMAVVSAISDETLPRWMGLLDLGRHPQDNKRVLHLEIKNRPQLVSLPPGRYAIDHFDFTETIAGDERTIRISGAPEIEITEGTVRYFGNVLIDQRNVRLMVNWDTVDVLCRDHSHLLSAMPVVMGAPGETLRTVTDPCDSVNL